MNSRNLHLLAVTTDQTISQVLHQLDMGESWRLIVYDDPARVFAARTDNVDVLVIDDSASGGGYMSAVKKARRTFPPIDIIVIGGPKSDEVRAAEKRDGIDYYYERPVDTSLLAGAVEHRMRLAELKASVGLVGRAPAIEEILEAILQVAPTEVPILIEGESGTGKDIVARAIHMASRRSEGPYVAINCASLAEGVLESELFGHEKGAFTGAVGQRAGVFERANKGTIFLDEVGEMSPNMQVRLLRVLESGDVLRVGGVKSFRVDVRVVAATNRNLGEAVAHGNFRQDLYYRLKGISLHLPALRERKDDIPILTDHFIREANRKHGKSVQGIDRDALGLLRNNHWPGNVRELRNLVDTAVVLTPSSRITAPIIEGQLSAPIGGETTLPVRLGRSKGEAEREMIYAAILALHRDVRDVLAMLREVVHARPLDSMREVYPDGEGPGVQSLSSLERGAILEALRASGGNRRRAADMLGISERTLYRKIKEYGLV